MPYTNIHWVKLEKRLLNDHRFYTMSEESQLIYVKLLMLAAETKNKVPKNPLILKAALRSVLEEGTIKKCMEEIKTVFPKFKETNSFYKFDGWGVRHNWVADKERQWSTKGTARGVLDKNRTEQNKADKESIKHIVGVYVNTKGYDTSKWTNGDWTRIQRGAKELLLRGKDSAEIVQAIFWMNKQGYEWTIETVLKKFPDFLQQKPSDRVLNLHEKVMSEQN